MEMPMIHDAGGGEAAPGFFAVSPGGASMRVNVLLNCQAAELLRNGFIDSPAVGDVVRTVGELGIKLVPVYPKSRDRRLKAEFVVEVPDAATAERVVDRLSALAATEAAYVKPDEEPP
jgi:hypothetical protein